MAKCAHFADVTTCNDHCTSVLYCLRDHRISRSISRKQYNTQGCHGQGKYLENNFFPGQGKVREFYGWSRKFRKDLESQGKDREFENKWLSMAGRLQIYLFCSRGKRCTFSWDSLSPCPSSLGAMGNKFFPLRVTPKFEVIHLAPLNTRIKMWLFLSVRGYGKLQNVREKSGKSQGILRWMISGNPDTRYCDGLTQKTRVWHGQLAKYKPATHAQFLFTAKRYKDSVTFSGKWSCQQLHLPEYDTQSP